MRRVFVIILVLVILWLQYRAWYGENSQHEIDLLNQKIDNQVEHNQTLFEQNKLLKQEVRLIRNEPKILEEKARENLGLIKKNEIFYRIIPADES
jgi:cell division protein FtsB